MLDRLLTGFLAKFTKIRYEPLIKALHSMLTLKWGLGNKTIVYSSYKNHALALLLLDTLHKWINSFFFI